MLMLVKDSAHLVQVISIQDLLNPYEVHVTGRLQWGEEEQDPEPFEKANLCFLSGEQLPRCWTDPHYRDSVEQPAAQVLEQLAKLKFNDAQVPVIY